MQQWGEVWSNVMVFWSVVCCAVSILLPPPPLTVRVEEIPTPCLYTPSGDLNMKYLFLTWCSVSVPGSCSTSWGGGTRVSLLPSGFILAGVEWDLTLTAVSSPFTWHQDKLIVWGLWAEGDIRTGSCSQSAPDSIPSSYRMGSST